MPRNALRATLFLVSVVLFFAILGVAGKTKTIDIYTDAFLPDGQELKAGKYQVVVDEKADQVEFMKGSKVVVKHRCKCVQQERKNGTNRALYTERQDKRLMLTELRFGGETRVIHLEGGM